MLPQDPGGAVEGAAAGAVARRAGEEEARALGDPPHGEPRARGRAEDAVGAQAEGDAHLRLCLVGEADERERHVGAHERARRVEPGLPRGQQRPGDAQRRPARPDADGGARHDAEPPLAAEDHRPEVGAGRGRGEGRQLQAAAGGLEGDARHEVGDAADAERLLARGAGRDPASERGELEGLREVPEGEAALRERRLEAGPEDAGAEGREPGALVEREEAGEPAEVEGHGGRVAPGRVHAARDGRPAAPGDDAHPGARAGGERGGDLRVVGRPDDRVGRRRRPPGPHPEEVGQALAPRVGEAIEGVGRGRRTERRERPWRGQGRGPERRGRAGEGRADARGEPLEEGRRRRVALALEAPRAEAPLRFHADLRLRPPPAGG